MNRVLAFSFLLFVSACGTLVSRSVVLHPERLGSDTRSWGDRVGPCSGLSRRGAGSSSVAQWRDSGGVAAHGVIVSYSNSFYPGADPFPCSDWIHSIAQGKISFDVTSIPRDAIIDSVTLISDRRVVLDETRGTIRESVDCSRIAASGYFMEFGTASTLPVGELTRSGPLPYRGGVDVITGRLGARWLTTVRRDFEGLFHIIASPKPELIRVRHNLEDGIASGDGVNTRYCAVYIDNITLNIEMRVPIPPL